MYKIKRGHILAAMLCVFAFIFCMVFGFRNYTCFAFAALAFVGYYYADRKMLRCPKCGSGTNFELLMRAMRTGVYHCRHCWILRLKGVTGNETLETELNFACG